MHIIMSSGPNTPLTDWDGDDDQTCLEAMYIQLLFFTVYHGV